MIFNCQNQERQKREKRGNGSPMNNKVESQRVCQIRCEQALNSLKSACIHSCSQGGYGLNKEKCNFQISAHSLRLEIKSFYGIWSFFKKWGKSSPILTTPTHPLISRKWSELERMEVSKLS